MSVANAKAPAPGLLILIKQGKAPLMTKPDVLAIMDQFWSSAHGLPGHLGEPGVHVGIARPTREPRILLLVRGSTTLVSGPADLAPWLRSNVPAMPDPFDERSWSNLPNHPVVRTIGPAFLGCLSPENFAPSELPHQTRPLTMHDQSSIHALRMACEPAEWEHSAMDDPGATLHAGAFHSGELIAAATCRQWTDQIADVGVVTHPAHRGLGFGLSAAAGATRGAMSRGLVVFWRTLLANHPSQRLARRLGFSEYAVTLSVRLSRQA